MTVPERVNDIPTYLFGGPAEYGVKQPSPEFSQGEDVMLELALYVDSSPLTDITDWTLDVIVKKSVQANNELWTGSLDDGLYKRNNNIYLLRIPGEDTAKLLPGTYFYAIKGTKLVTPEGFARTAVIAKGTINITTDASSPNSKVFGINAFTGDSENTLPLLITDLPMTEEVHTNVGL